MNIRKIFNVVTALGLLTIFNSCNNVSVSDLEEIKQNFVNPPESARPGSLLVLYGWQLIQRRNDERSGIDEGKGDWICRISRS